jgi:hypothetical protein
VLKTHWASSTIRMKRHSKPRYKSRLSNDRESLSSSLLLSLSSSLSKSESESLRSKSSFTLFLVLFACSLVSASLFYLLNCLLALPSRTTRHVTRERHKTRHTTKHTCKVLEKGSCETTCFVYDHTTLTGLTISYIHLFK